MKKRKENAKEFVTLGEIYHEAKRNLRKEVWDYFAGGADSETTLRRNQEAMAHFEFRPRVLRGLRDIDISTTFLGLPISLPIMIAPIASLYLIDKQGDLAMAKAAARVKTIHWLTTRTAQTPESVAKSLNTSLIFQLFWRGDNKWCRNLVRRIEDLGFKALAITVDTPMYGRRERDLENRFNHRTIPRGIDVPMNRAIRELTLAWKDVAWLRRITRLPLIIKGIQCQEDARLAIEHGVDCVYVSNHGGRQLDYAAPTIEILAEIVDTVGGKAEVIVDGGFQRGTDVLKALAFGAKAICIGKAAAWGLAVGGEEGVVRTLELFGIELKTAMANVGVGKIADITPKLVRKACIYRL